MARPAEFAREDAVDAALRLFWIQGYTATSLQQLLEAMAIGRSSFYAAFGGKRALFLECLDLFYQRTRQVLERAMVRSSPDGAIVQFFEDTLIRAPARRVQRGCMMVNTVLELADVDETLSRRAASHLAGIEALLAQCLRDAQAMGRYPADRVPEAVGAVLMIVNQGLRVASRTGVSRPRLKELLQHSLAANDLKVA